jgi:NAD(P)-dependent dehydrogenase (short-subunit alcohol dehydrogenase family)
MCRARGTLRDMTTRIAVVTGANRGLGLHFVDQLQRRGHSVIAGVRRPAEADALHALAPLAVLPLDTGDAESIRAFGDAVRRHAERVDVLVNNAGIMSASAAPVDLRPADDAPANGPLPFLEAEAMLTMFRVNSIGPVLVAQALDHLLGAGSVVVNLSSRLGSIALGDTDDYGYGMSKAALNMATTLLARELGGRGVVTVSISPGWVRTDMGGSGAMLEAPDSTGSIANVIGRLGSADNGTFIDHTGRPIAW